MRTRSGRTTGSAVALILGLGGLIGCQATTPPTSPPLPDVTVTIPVPVTDKTVALAAADVLSARIRQLGYGTFSSGGGDVMTYTFPGDPPPDLAKIRAALGAHGSLTFLPLPSDAELPSDGGSPPAGIQPLFDPAGAVESASVVNDQTGTPTLALHLAPDAAAALADWSGTHVGDYFVMVLDGVVLATPVLNAEIPDGNVALSFPTNNALPYDLDVLAAILSSGPLPPEWR